MKFRKLYFLFLSVSPVLLLSAEPSAFGAGDLSASNPYGLTNSEKVLLATEKKLKTVAQKSNTQANQLDSLRERIDGLQSIIESLGRKTHENQINLHNLQNSTTASFENINEYQKRLALSIQENKEAIDEVKTITSKLHESLEALRLDYVTRADYNTLVKDVNSFKLLVASELKKKSTQRAKKSSITSAALYNRAKSRFNKKLYTAAISDYQELIKRKYKPAYSHYMIGEMYYKRKDYAKAISYFKKSASLYSKASYMPKLMLHTAISMLKTGDKKHANAFFDAIVVKYPNSKEARKAKEYLGI
jgi:TolA-binding protein